MLSILTSVTFLQPLILLSLLCLPILWFILRITPPAPRRIFFPATRFLMELASEETTPNKSPWWLLLLRLCIAALIIIALANPVMNAADPLKGQNNVRILMDNSWAGAQMWHKQQDAALEMINQAKRENRDIYILASTSKDQEKPKQYGPLTHSDALSIIRGLTPNPWPADYSKLAEILKEDFTDNQQAPMQTAWLSHGLNEQSKAGELQELFSILQEQGGLTLITPSADDTPLILRAPKNKQQDNSTISIDIEAPDNIDINAKYAVQVLSRLGPLDAKHVSLTEDQSSENISFDIAPTQQNTITQFQISARQGAGATYLVNDKEQKRKVGVVAPTQEESTAPLIEESFYIRRALEPYADVKTGDIEDLLKEEVDVLILPDIAAMPSDTLNILEDWVKNGGLLLRFAGPNMAQNNAQPFLLPVDLRRGERSLSGALSWDEPQKIAPFSDNSPFYGLSIPDDVHIKQQLLAAPTQDLDKKIWANLSDGTPLITADTLDRGLTVFIHTTANTEWSSFALSGLYVSVLKRIINMAGTSYSGLSQDYKSLDPILVMDGYGALKAPSASVKPIKTEELSKIIPSAEHPPGFYGRGSVNITLNLGDNLLPLKAMTDLPLHVNVGHYDEEYEHSLMPYLLYAAVLLLCLDWLIMIFLIGNGMALRRFIPVKAAFTVLACCTLLSAPADAATPHDVEFAKGFYLAYIKTGDTALDRRTENGLNNLAEVLAMRTSVEPHGVAALNPEYDTLTFFPIIYWALSPLQNKPSYKAMKNIQSYLDHGGTIIFDTRDQNRTNAALSANTKKLREITSSLNIPPIAPIPDDHVLSRSFYLLDGYPGEYESGTLWIETFSTSGRDNVSSVLIGGNNWAEAWAQNNVKSPFHPYSATPQNTKLEHAMRFGVNLVMYALTGNYKADQVHIPHILERLGDE